jgi:hypothetical protein
VFPPHDGSQMAVAELSALLQGGHQMLLRDSRTVVRTIAPTRCARAATSGRSAASSARVRESVFSVRGCDRAANLELLDTLGPVPIVLVVHLGK